MFIRPATLEDLPTIQQLNNDIFFQNKIYNPDYIHQFADTLAGEKYFKEAINHPDGCFFVLENKNKIIGFINGYPKPVSSWDCNVFEIDNIGVLTEYQRQGSGNLLLDHVISWAKQHGYNRIYISSYAANNQAISFYKKHGFQPLEISLIKTI
jgi:ribosomal protein S18 acetylase RimI-like enzyme